MLARTQRGPTGAVWEAAKAEKNWLVYRLDEGAQPGKLAKRPTKDGRRPMDRREAATLTFDEAVATAAGLNLLSGAEDGRPGWVGIGYFPRAGAAMRAYDLDDCVEPDGSITNPDVSRILAHGETFAEKSVSGRGVRLWGAPSGHPLDDQGTEKDGFGASGVEGKFFTFRGEALDGSPLEVRPAPNVLGTILAKTGGRSKSSRQGQWGGPVEPIDESACEGRLDGLLAADAPFSRRWAGDTDGLNDPSRSGLDLAVIGGLARAGFSFSEIVHLMLGRYEPESAVADDWRRGDERQMRRAFERARPITAQEEFEPVQLPSRAAGAPFSAWCEIDLARIPYPVPVYSDFYARGYTSVTAATPKVGKSLLALAEAIDMATGRGFLTGQPCEPLKVVYFNLEDDQDVINNRVAAVLDHFGISQAEIAGHLYANSGVSLDWHLVSGQEGDINEARFAELRDFVVEQKPDVLIFDPLQDLSRSPETNEVFRKLGQRLRAFASTHQIAIGLVHHTRKGAPGVEPGLDDMRGGSALRGTARFNRLLVGMTEKEAAEAGVSNHRAFFRVGDAESNLAPPSAAINRWFEKVSVPVPSGHWIGAVSPWTWPDASEGVTEFDIARVRAEMERQPDRCRASVQARGGWAGNLVGELLGIDVSAPAGKARVKALIDEWLRRRYLRKTSRKDPTAKRDTPYLEPGDVDPLEGRNVL